MQLGGDEHTNCVATGMLLYFSGLLSRSVKKMHLTDYNRPSPCRLCAKVTQVRNEGQKGAALHGYSIENSQMTSSWGHLALAVRALKEGEETPRRPAALDVPHFPVLQHTPKSPSFPAVTFVILLFWGSATLI